MYFITLTKNFKGSQILKLLNYGSGGGLIVRTQGGGEIFLVASYYKYRGKLWSGEPLGSCADITFF